MTSLDRETEYLSFHEVPSPGSTRRWFVSSRSSEQTLGLIRWHGPWRQFVFYPEQGTLFNRGCLEDVNRFLTDALTDWRESKKQRV